MSGPDATPQHLPVAAATLARELRLDPLPHEGGLYRRTYSDDHSTAIYYLLAAPDFSALHALDAVEVYHWYSGDPLQLLLLHPDGAVETPVLGPDVTAGQVPQLVVPAGVWQGSHSVGGWTLVGTTMSPGFTWEGFRLGERQALQGQYPEAADRISRLTRCPHA